MAEMTVEQAISLLKNRTPAWLGPALFYISERESQQIAALLEAQQAEIEKLKCCGNCKQLIFGRLCEVHCDERNRADKCDKWEGESKGGY